MTKRKPDFYVVRREWLNGEYEWFTYAVGDRLWSCRLILRQQFAEKAGSAKIAKKYGGRVVGVYCSVRTSGSRR